MAPGRGDARAALVQPPPLIKVDGPNLHHPQRLLLTQALKDATASPERRRMPGPEGQGSIFLAGQEKRGCRNTGSHSKNLSVNHLLCSGRAGPGAALCLPLPCSGTSKAPDSGCRGMCPSCLSCSRSPGSKSAFPSRRGLQAENPLWLQHRSPSRRLGEQPLGLSPCQQPQERGKAQMPRLTRVLLWDILFMGKMGGWEQLLGFSLEILRANCNIAATKRTQPWDSALVALTP